MATRNKGGLPMWTGAIRFVPKMLDLPTRWKKPRMIFVNSMSDLFHENLTTDVIRAGFDMMASADRHIYQILTKRAERMAEVMADLTLSNGRHLGKDPLENVWLGTSVGFQKTVSRIIALRQTPAAIRFVSAEPLIGGIAWEEAFSVNGERACDWVIFGGESQTRCRPMDLEWVRGGIAACRKLGIAPYVKQLGTVWAKQAGAKDRAGADPEEWPVDLRVQEFPFDVRKRLAA